jgi:hypothetical protein
MAALSWHFAIPERPSTMRFLIGAFALLAIAATGTTTVSAAGLSGIGKAIFGNESFRFTRANLKAPPVGTIKAGGLRIELQRTRLADLKKAFGGTIRQQSYGNGDATWLCYTTDGTSGPAANVWFISNILGGNEFVMMVAAGLADPRRPASDCDPAPAKFSPPDFGIPTLGATTAELKAALGSASSSGGAISYRADEPAKDALGTALNVQYIGYLVARGQVTGVGVGEGSAPQ